MGDKVYNVAEEQKRLEALRQQSLDYLKNALKNE